MARPGRGSGDGWFRLGSLEFTTVVLALALSVVSVVEWAFEGDGGVVQSELLLTRTTSSTDSVWRLLTWPLAYPFGIGLLGILAVAFF